MKERQVIVQSLQGIPFRVWTLEEAVDLMGRLQLGRSFKPHQNARIVAFLITLTGRQPTFQIPVLPPSSNSTPRPKLFQ